MVGRIFSPLGAVVLLWAITDLIRATCLLIYGPLETTTIATLLDLFGTPVTAAIFAITSLGSIYAILSPRRSWSSFYMLLMQQLLLIICAIGPVTAMILSRYADGVIRSRGFLLADQIPHVTPVLVHMAAVSAYWLPEWAAYTPRGPKDAP